MSPFALQSTCKLSCPEVHFELSTFNSVIFVLLASNLQLTGDIGARMSITIEDENMENGQLQNYVNSAAISPIIKSQKP